MILSMYQKAVLVSELQEMKRLKQSPHNYKFSHNWVYKHKMQRMWSMQGFLLAPQSFTHWSSPATAALQSPKAGINPDSLPASPFPPALTSPNKHIPADHQLDHPTKPSVFGFFPLSFDKFTLSKSALPAKPAQCTVNRSCGHVGLDWPHTPLLGTPKWTPQLGPVPPLSSCAFTALLSGSRNSHH